MRCRSGLALGSLGSFWIGVALATFVAGFDVQGAAMPPVRGIDPATIDRTLKGDRLPSAPNPARRSSEPPLPQGCVAASEWRKNIYAPEVAGRCVA